MSTTLAEHLKEHLPELDYEPIFFDRFKRAKTQLERKYGDTIDEHFFNSWATKVALLGIDDFDFMLEDDIEEPSSIILILRPDYSTT